MQKQESFYYQARARAPTDTNAAAIGRAPGLDYIAYIGSIHGKKGFLGRGMSDWSLSFEGLCVSS